MKKLRNEVKRPAVLKCNHLTAYSWEKNDKWLDCKKWTNFSTSPLNKFDQLKILIPFFNALMKTEMEWGIFVPSFN